MTAATSRATATPPCPAGTTRLPSSGGEHESRGTATSKPTPLSGNSPFSKVESLSSKNPEALSRRRSEAAADQADAPRGGSTEPASLENKSAKTSPCSEELRASVHEAGGVAGSEAELLSSKNPEALSRRNSEAAADQSATPCGGSTEPASLEKKSGKPFPFSEVLRASVHEGGGVAGSEAELLSSRNQEALSRRRSEAAADQTDAPCGGSTELASLESNSTRISLFSDELRASAHEGGGVAGSRADSLSSRNLEALSGRSSDSPVRFDSTWTSWQNPRLQSIMGKADIPDVSLGLSLTDVGKLRALVNGKTFEGICSAIIFCNAVFIAVASDYEMRHLDDYRTDTSTRCFFALEKAFFLFYLFEILIRIYAFGRSFFRGNDGRWNCFDLFLVTHAIFDQASQWVSLTNVGVANLASFRIMRLLKMIKLLRVFRLVRTFRGLRLVLNGIICSMQAMSYAMILITATTFMFGTAIVQSCTIYLQDEEPDAQTFEEIYELWGSVPQAMLSLFMASTSGDSWRLLARPLEKVGLHAYAIFVLYLTFFACVITNTLTSLIVENSITFAAADEQWIIRQEMERKDEYVQKLKRLFDLIDTDGSGEITYIEFLANLSSPILDAFASSLEMDIHDAREFFHVLSGGGTQKVDVQTFVVGCIKLKGNARSMDLMELMHSEKKSTRELVWQQQVLLQRVDSVNKALSAMCDLIVRPDPHAAMVA